VQPIRVRVFAGALALLASIATLPARAQYLPAQPLPPADVLLGPAQLEQLVAPVALYPDPLLGQVLIASTYPLEIVHAARWVRDSAGLALDENALQTVLADKDWDPSVKSLVPFPQVLNLMDSQLLWTQRLGDAFLAQEADVMNAVQSLRHRALADGTLRSTAEQTVSVDGQTIIIVPARREVVYVPYYDPTYVYGAWPYPAYPPYYFPPPPSYYVEPSVIPGFYFFAGGIAIVSWLWDWSYYDWRRHRFYVDARRYNRIHHGHRPISGGVWVHDHYHRRSVPYPTKQTREHYEGSGHAHGPDSQHDHRGYDSGGQPPGGMPPVESAAPPAAVVADEPKPKSKEPDRPRPRVPRTAPPPGSPVATPEPGQPRAYPPRESGPRGTDRPRTAPPVRPARESAPVPERRRSVPPAFQEYGSGAQVRREAERGRASRESAPTPRTERPGKASPPPERRAPERGERQQDKASEPQRGERSRR